MQDQKPNSSAIKLSLLKPPEGEPKSEDTEKIQERKFCSKINMFILNLVLLNIARMALKMNLAGTIRTIERRFGFRSATTSYIFSLTEFTHIALVLFLGHFGRFGHKPRMIGITSIFPAVAGLLMAAPYFILPSSSPQERSFSNASVFMPHGGAQMCNADPVDEGCDRGMDQNTQNNIAVGFFLVGSLLAGVGGPAAITLGIPYIDENSSRAKTAIGVGFVTASFALGPVLGLLLASACTRLPESLKASDMEPTDPNFIGAWWLGFVLGSVAVFLLATPILFYPKHLISKATGTDKRSREQHQKRSTCSKLTAIFQKVGQLLRIKAYMILLISDLLMMFVAVGVFMNLPRYLEIYFLMPAYQTNIVAAVSAGGMSLVGSLLGGAILSRLKVHLRGVAVMLLVCSGVSLVIAGLFLLFRCPKLQLDGEFDVETNGFSVTTTCNRNCSCLANKKTYMPVCGDNDLTFFSPCHAGCTLSANGSFHDCNCTESGTARVGFCLETCPLFLPFAIGLALASLAGGSGRPAYIIGAMRTVPDNERSFALAFKSFVINLFGLLPGPIFFGHMIDTACDVWQTICGEGGNCLFYDSDKFLWRTYGIGVACFFVNFLVIILFVCLVRREGSSWSTMKAGQREIKPAKGVECDNDEDAAGSENRFLEGMENNNNMK